ncbi:hypothetical protein [Entomospira culicis]|nr:hypothetical protein [Entomospira culicis]WDI37739.1 hypothetical protein PVA46_02855 [Entomospira culicis]WDI39367.1 hypothetical protein PVA47_02860 [Entomospira culicis]
MKQWLAFVVAMVMSLGVGSCQSVDKSASEPISELHWMKEALRL